VGLQDDPDHQRGIDVDARVRAVLTPRDYFYPPVHKGSHHTFQFGRGVSQIDARIAFLFKL
jgi:hypothetical protein